MLDPPSTVAPGKRAPITLEKIRVYTKMRARGLIIGQANPNKEFLYFV
jgi:hypothetical protein